jgi:hypothetical protein
VRALIATLDENDPAPRSGGPLSSLWHWLYFLEAVRASKIGSDGHPERGGSCRRCRCPAACGPAAASPSRASRCARKEADGSVATWIATESGGLGQQGKATFR